MTIHGEQGIHREIRTFNRLRSGSLLVMIRGPFGNGLQRIFIAREAQDVEKPAVFSIAGGSVDCHDPSGRQFGNVYQKSHPLT